MKLKEELKRHRLGAVLYLRLLNYTYDDIAAMFKLSRERIRQIEYKAVRMATFRANLNRKGVGK